MQYLYVRKLQSFFRDEAHLKSVKVSLAIGFSVSKFHFSVKFQELPLKWLLLNFSVLLKSSLLHLIKKPPRIRDMLVFQYGQLKLFLLQVFIHKHKLPLHM